MFMSMRQDIADVLHLPSVRALQIGALSALAAFTVQTGRISVDFLPADAQVIPQVLEAEPVAGSGVDYQPEHPAPAPQPAQPAPAPESGQPGLAEETELGKGVPGAIQNYIDHNTVIIGALGCSGSLIRNNRGVPVGALTAAHCVTSDAAKNHNPLVRGADGERYIVSDGPVTLERGIDVVNLEPVGDVQEFIVPPRSSGSDQALAVLPGHDPGDVMRNYRRRLLSDTEISRLRANDVKIWTSGYPITQNGDAAGNVIRQELPTTYIGQDTMLFAPSGAITFERVATATVKTNSNGAMCSWGLSGAEGLVLTRFAGEQHKSVRSIGNFSTFMSFSALQEGGGRTQSISAEDAASSRRYYHVIFPQADWQDVDGVCSYSTEPIGKNRRLVYTAPSLDAVPGY